ncbi:C40 family peptidase [Pedobacter cryoconitis]|uniref:Lipoprotein Spr/probable lipoprotein NlpC n=1 Tax=Pedobacter cryoconitis TaxID=188932 RepID=A0A7X0MHK0_9SPHI|nr:NlpC/P60 family protein [Pedobacter cryoconitis]MBB6498931.1 lipoprotein Spr/probable lipoprotein NlpC [Pedobacter cryoconitis]
MTLRSIRCSYLIILLAALTVFSSCRSRKTASYKENKEAKAAEVLSNVKSKALYRFITDWTGVRYRLGGLDKNGIDCSGFALLLNKEIYGLKLPRRSRDQADVIRNTNPSQLKEGDLIFFSFGGNGIDHVGVYLNHGFFVHASTTRGVVVDDLTLPAYQRTLIKAGPVRD